MTPELRDWLLDCPELRGISSLALDAGACGLVDLAEQLPRAVAADVRMRTSVVLNPHRPARVALARARRLRNCRIEITGGIAILSGPIGPDAVVAELEGIALLEVCTPIPDTIALAMVGRPLSELISSPLLDLRRYVVVKAGTGNKRTLLCFAVPTVAIFRKRPTVARVSRAF